MSVQAVHTVKGNQSGATWNNRWPALLQVLLAYARTLYLCQLTTRQ